MNRPELVLLIMVILPFTSNGQGDSILSAERSIDRPITLHKKQLRVGGNYQLSVITRQYNENSEVVKLRDEGLASVRHRLGLEVKYGINDFVQLTTAIGQSNHTVREQSRVIFPVYALAEPSVYENTLHEYAGANDLSVAVDVRAPFKTRKFDLAATVGATLPTARSDPDTPTHSIQYVDNGSEQEYDVVYRYNYNLGNGVPVAQLGGMFKYRTSHWAISGRVDYRHGLKENTTYEWRHELINYKSFTYRQEPFTYRLADAFEYYAELEYQALPWIDVILNVSGYHSQNGWHTSGQNKVADPEAGVILLNPGYELIVTPRLWFRQRFQIPISGKSYEGAFTFNTSLTYNLFPF